MRTMALAKTGPGLARWVAAVLAIALITGACSDTSRPDVGEWRTDWLGVVEALPDLAELSGDASKDLCADALAMLRSTSGDLLPTPDLAIDDTVRSWVELAEDAFFECPPRGGEINSFATAYAEMERLQAEVAVVLQLDS